MNGDVCQESCGENIPTEDSQNSIPDHMMEGEAGEDCSSIEIGQKDHKSPNLQETDTMATGSNMASGEPNTKNEGCLPGDSPPVPITSPEPSHDTGQSDGAKVQQTEGSNEENAEASQVEPLSVEKIKQLVLEQVPLFFSRENWSSDPYLLSQMDSDQYVPVYILANCSQFHNITKNHLTILEALRESEFVQLDESNSRVRPNYKRCIVILREIPESTPSEEIEALFENETCPKVISCEFVNNNSWYVTFDNDNDAQKAYRYLRETVRTFKDRPILARIKTKPMSRIGCFNVLPSYGNNAHGKPQNGPVGPIAPGMHPPGGQVGSGTIPNVPNPPPAVAAPGSYNPARVYYPNNVNTYNYFPGSSSPMPTAFFYPNLVGWPTPNFYDINSFMQYNGLQPRATFKPPTNNRFNNVNNNRRHASGGSTASGTSRPAPSSRPQSVNSPHLVNSSSGSQASLGQPNSSARPDVIGQSTGPPHAPSSFTQNDLSSLASQSLYTSFSAPIENASLRADSNNIGPEGERGLPGASESLANPSSHLVTPNPNISMDSVPIIPPPSMPTSNSGVSMQNVYAQAHSHLPSSPIVPQYHHPSQRNGYIDPQPSRQIANARGGGGRNRRVPRREDEIAGAPPASQNNRNGFQRGGIAATGADPNQRASFQDRRKPQFELQATSFPPLPGADEAPEVPEEIVQEPQPAKPWVGGDVHKFSDIMKGTAKPPQEKSVEKETPAPSSVVPEVPSISTIGNATQQTSSTGSTSHSVSQETSCVTAAIDVTVTSTTISTHVEEPSTSQVVPVTQVNPDKSQSAIVVKDPKTATCRAEEKRGPLGRREGGFSREFTAGNGRGGKEGGPRREMNRFSGGNKENNRPQGATFRSWRDERPDSDGWVTKGAREPRNNRPDNKPNQLPSHSTSHPHENRPSNNNRSTHMLNGDCSPPPSPKIEQEHKSLDNGNVCNEVKKTNAKNLAANANEEETCSLPNIEKKTVCPDSNRKPSWANMARSGKNEMEKLSAELKEKDEQERLKKSRMTVGRPQTKLPDKSTVGPRERDNKPFRKDTLPFSSRDKDRSSVEGKGSSERNQTFKPKEHMRPKSPK